MDQYYPWFKFFFLLGGVVKYEETKENEIGTEDKLNHNLYTLASLYWQFKINNTGQHI